MLSILKIFRRLTGKSSLDPRPLDPELERLIASAYPRADPADPDTAGQWSRLERSVAGGAEGPESEAPRAKPALWRIAPRMQPGLIPRYAVGLAVIIAIAALTIFQISRVKPRHFVTARGEQSVVTLPDASEVLLNHTSTLDFDVAGFLNDRRVRLTGEALFKVTRIGAPFRVVTDAGKVTVTGTKFNVRARGGRYEIGVTEGSVSTILPVLGGDTAIALSAGEAVSGRRDDYFPDVRRIGNPNYPGWNERTLIFTRMDLWTVCQEVMDYFDIRIRLEDASLGKLSITGAIDARDARNVLTSICLLTGRQFRHEGDTYIIF